MLLEMARSRGRTGTGRRALLEDDAAVAAGLADANVPTLLAMLVQLTGDLDWLDDRFRPQRPRGLSDEDDGGLAADVVQGIRAAAALAIGAWRGGKPAAIPDPSDELVTRILEFTLNEPVPAEYGPMMRMDLNGRLAASLPSDHSVRSKSKGGETPQVVGPSGDGFFVVVIGAGPCGIAAGAKLDEAGIPYVIVEKNKDVAGTWLQNRYPGAAVDTPSHLYSFSFAPWDWSRFFAGREELAEYLSHVADTFDVRRHIRFGYEVLSARYDEAVQLWHLQIRDEDGRCEQLTAPVVISAVGALNRPSIPVIPGLADFAGPSFHTARWPDGLDVTGKRVAVIGTGASAMQLVPALSKIGAKVIVFQRTPQWAAPFDRFQVSIPAPLRAIMTEVPYYTAWYRLRQAWIFNDKIYPTLQKDPDWAYPERAVNAVNDAHRLYFSRYIAAEIGDRADLLPKVLPKYPPFSKRMLLDNGWFRAMTKPNVVLETDDILTVTSDRIITVGGAEHVVDVIALATGFDALHFLAPIEIRGRSGVTLSETWDGDDARAFLGLAVPDFPNLFCLYGPNTQTAHGGSLMYIAECQLRYIIDLLTQAQERGIGQIECRQSSYDEYNRRVDEAHDRMIWTHPGVSTYYRNARGRVVMNSPWRIVDFWQMTQRADLADFETEPVATGAAAESS
jgi:4-hydroxyacetophenone monooxygenase